MWELVCSYYTISGKMPGSDSDESSSRSFEGRARACAKAGFTGMGIHLQDYLALRRSGIDDATIAAILDDNGMHRNEVEFLSDFYFGSFDPRTKISQEAERQLYHVAGVTRARHIHVGEYIGERLSQDQLQSGFAGVCRRARERGLKVALEFMPLGSIPDLASGLRVVRGAGAVNGGILLDSWHLHRSNSKLDDLSVKELVSVQLSDAKDPLTRQLSDDTVRRLLPGEGDIDLPGLIRWLASGEYTGPVALEVISKVQAEKPLEQAAFDAANSTRRVVEASL